MSLIAKLIEAGTPPELVEEVALLVAEKRIAEQAIATRREKDRDRQARKRGHVMSRDVTLDDVTERDPSLSRPPNEKISNPPTHTHPDNNTPREGSRTKPHRPAKPDEVSEQTWADFVHHRKAKRAPVSETAMAGIRREAKAAGWTLEAALAETVLRGWQSFKAEFVTNGKPANAPGAGSFLASLGSGP